MPLNSLPLVLIAENTLQAPSATLLNVTLANLRIPYWAKHLVVKWHAASDQAAGGEPIIRINGDSAGNHVRQRLLGSSSAISSATTTTATGLVSIEVPGTTLANEFAGGTTLIPHYAGTAHRKLGLNQAGRSTAIYTSVSERPSTDAVTSVSIVVSAGNFVAGSWVGLYVVDETKSIGSTILTGSAASLSLSSIPQMAGDLVVVSIQRTDRVNESDTGNIYFNADSTAGNYAFQTASGNNATAAAASGTALGYFQPTGASATAGQFGAAVTVAPDYANTARLKQMSILRGKLPPTAAGRLVGSVAVKWASAAAVSAFTTVPVVGPNFVAGSGIWGYVVPR